MKALLFIFLFALVLSYQENFFEVSFEEFKRFSSEHPSVNYVLSFVNENCVSCKADRFMPLKAAYKFKSHDDLFFVTLQSEDSQEFMETCNVDPESSYLEMRYYNYVTKQCTYLNNTNLFEDMNKLGYISTPSYIFTFNKYIAEMVKNQTVTIVMSIIDVDLGRTVEFDNHMEHLSFIYRNETSILFTRFFCYPQMSMCSLFYEDPLRRLPAVQIYQSKEYNYTNQELKSFNLTELSMINHLNKLFGYHYTIRDTVNSEYGRDLTFEHDFMNPYLSATKSLKQEIYDSIDFTKVTNGNIYKTIMKHRINKGNYIDNKRKEIEPVYKNLKRNSTNYFKVMSQYNIINAFRIVTPNSGLELTPFTISQLVYDDTENDIAIYIYDLNSDKCRNILDVTFKDIYSARTDNTKVYKLNTEVNPDFMERYNLTGFDYYIFFGKHHNRDNYEIKFPSAFSATSVNGMIDDCVDEAEGTENNHRYLAEYHFEGRLNSVPSKVDPKEGEETVIDEETTVLHKTESHSVNVDITHKGEQKININKENDKVNESDHNEEKKEKEANEEEL